MAPRDVKEVVGKCSDKEHQLIRVDATRQVGVVV